ncbi:MAG: transposase [Planctomycetota bacterium]
MRRLRGHDRGGSWASSESRFTRAFEELTAYLAQITEETTVTKMMGIAWRTVGRRIVRELGGSPEAHEIKGTRFALLKKPRALSPSENEKLSFVQQTDERPSRAYFLKETFGDALDYLQPARAHTAFTGWLAWASRSRRKPFVRVAGIIPKRFDGINLRTVARRAFGFRGPGPLIAMLLLTCGGIPLDPPLPP